MVTTMPEGGKGPGVLTWETVQKLYEQVSNIYLPKIEIWIGPGQFSPFEHALIKTGLFDAMQAATVLSPIFHTLSGIPILEKPYFQPGKGALMEYGFAEPTRCDFRFLLSWTNGTLEVLDIPARKGQQHNP